jgi:hypothetical protein
MEYRCGAVATAIGGSTIPETASDFARPRRTVRNSGRWTKRPSGSPAGWIDPCYAWFCRAYPRVRPFCHPAGMPRAAPKCQNGNIYVRNVGFGIADPPHSGERSRQVHSGSSWSRAGPRDRPAGRSRDKPRDKSRDGARDKPGDGSMRYPHCWTGRESCSLPEHPPEPAYARRRLRLASVCRCFTKTALSREFADL